MESREDFKIGDVYIHSLDHSKWTCIAFTSKGTPVLESKNGGITTVRQPPLWKEHREPLVRYGIYTGNVSLTRWTTEAAALEAVEHQYKGGRIVRLVEDMTYAPKG